MQNVRFNIADNFWGRFLIPTLGLAIAFSGPSALAQVSPAEILNPDLKALEETYFPQLKALNQSIAKTKFPFPFYLSRFVGIDPAQQAEADSRGLEFVRFQDRVILKITGFEISYHARSRERSYDFEGKENLVLVLDRDDARTLSRASTDPARQEILNRNKIYVSGTDFGLSLTERDPLNVQALPRSIPARPDATSTARSSTLVARSPLLNLNHPLPAVSPAVAAPADPAPANANPSSSTPKDSDPPLGLPRSAPADADRLNDKYQAQLASLAKLGAAKFHFVDYAPPTFMVFRDQIALQMTLRNSLQFGPAKGSIYKRAAQSFDLFLAPQMKDLSDRISPDVEFQLLDFSVLNKLSPGPKGTSEAIEFICPRAAVKQFVNAEITNQQLLDQSIILVNGVRIALNLQLVE